MRENKYRLNIRYYYWKDPKKIKMKINYYIKKIRQCLVGRNSMQHQE